MSLILSRERRRARQRRRARKGAVSSAQRLLDDFLGGGRSRHTVQAYRTDLARFVDFHGLSLETGVARLCGPSGRELAQAWLDALVGQESHATRRRRASTLRALRREGARQGLCDGELVVEVTKAPVASIPSIETVRRLLEACGDGPEGARNRALVLVIASLGLQRIETVRLQVDDYDWEQRRLRIGESWMDVPPETAAALEAWISLDKPTSALFHGVGRSSPLTGAGVADIFQRLSTKIGTEVHPGELRGFAQLVARERFSWTE